MENKEIIENQENNKGYILIVIGLLIIIFGLIACLAVALNKTNTKSESNNDEVSIQTINKISNI